MAGVITRRLMRSSLQNNSLFCAQTKRGFSLLVPLEPRLALPVELQNYSKTEQEFSLLQAKHEKLNTSAKEELKEMN